MQIRARANRVPGALGHGARHQTATRESPGHQRFSIARSRQRIAPIFGNDQFYRRFLPNAVHHQIPLVKLIPGNRKNDATRIKWTDDTINHFSECKKALANATLLVHPAPNAQIALSTDASDTAIGAALHQIVRNELQPLAFFSLKLTETQQRYSTYDRELLAVYLSIKHFRGMLEGRPFEVRTDHKPLIYAFKQSTTEHHRDSCVK